MQGRVARLDLLFIRLIEQEQLPFTVLESDLHIQLTAIIHIDRKPVEFLITQNRRRLPRQRSFNGESNLIGSRRRKSPVFMKMTRGRRIHMIAFIDSIPGIHRHLNRSRAPGNPHEEIPGSIDAHQSDVKAIALKGSKRGVRGIDPHENNPFAINLGSDPQGVSGFAQKVKSGVVRDQCF